MMGGSTKVEMLAVSMAALVVSTSLGCISITGSRNLITEEKTFADFTAVDAEDGFHVYIIQGEEFRVTITTDDNVMKQVTISKTGSKLSIGLKLGTYEGVVLRANITMPDLDEAELSGGSHLTAEGFNSTKFRLRLSGASHATLEGSADDLTASGSGGSHLKLQDFRVGDADVTLSGGSHATINVEGTLDADVRGGSHLHYLGNPTMGNIRASDGSHVSGMEEDEEDVKEGDLISEVFNETYDVEPGAVLKVLDASGGVGIRVWEKDQVEVYALKETRHGQKDLDDTIIRISAGRTMVVETEHKNRIHGSVTYSIRVPREVIVDQVDSVNGDIVIVGTTGNTTMTSTNGDIIADDVDGYVEADTTNGDIDIRRAGVLGATSIDGSVTVHVPDLIRDIQIQSTNGDVKAYLDADLDADIQASTGYGVVEVHDLQITLKQSSGTRVEGIMGNGGYVIDIKTTTGNIDLYRLE
jgi:DUF4097 and DUF4098 domain-containing protein YvlB